MTLSGETIRKREFITPFYERTVCNGMSFGLGPAGYDVRIRQSLILKPGTFTLVSIVEHLAMPDDLVGYIYDKSTLARLGVSLFNTIVESVTYRVYARFSPEYLRRAASALE